MSQFRQIPDEVNKEAGDILRYVHKGGPRPEIEVLPGFEQIVAASALALEKAAPNLMYTSSATPAERWVEEGTNEWRMMHRSVARTIDMHRQGTELFEEPSDVMNHILSNVVMQSEARRMDTAIRLLDPAFEQGLTESQIDTVRYAKDDPDVAGQIRDEAMGAYERAPDYAQREISSSLLTGDRLSPALKAEVSAAYDIVTRELNDLGENNRYVTGRTGDFQDFGKPLFSEITPAQIADADRLAHAPDHVYSNLEIAVVAHERIHPTTPGGIQDFEARVARARALADMDDRWEDPRRIAVVIEADRIEIEKARRVWGDIDGGTPVRDMLLAETLARGDEHHKLGTDEAIGLFQAIRGADEVPGLTAMRLSRAAVDVMAEDREHGKVKAAVDLVRPEDRVISYENITEEQAKDYRLDLYLPGDKVRFNDRVNIRDVDKDSIALTLGTEPLVVARTIVEGTTMEDGMGGVGKAVRPQYEFIGHDGRFPAGQFQHERGDEHVYGVVTMKDEKLWLVPLNPSHEIDRDTGRATDAPREVVGAAREIVAMENGEEGGPRQLKDFADQIRDEPAAGEFVFRPDAYGRVDGPVELVAVPWMSRADDAELKAADRAVVLELAPAQATHSMAARSHALAAASLGR